MSTAAASPALGYDIFASSGRRSASGLFDSFWKTDSRPSLASEQVRRDDIDARLALDPHYKKLNWNGEGAEPIPDAAFEEARAFLYQFPTNLPLPDVIVQPDGYLGLEWYRNKRLLYVVSFNGQGSLSCSGLIGQTRIYGTYYMDDTSDILSIIARVIQ